MKQKCLQILTQSFRENKSTNWVLKNRQEKRIHALMQYSYAICQKNGEVLSDENESSFALIHFPKQEKFSLAKIGLDLGFIFKVCGLKKMNKVMKREAYIKKQHPEGDFYYLWFLGVAPKMQGNGLGSKMLEKIKAKAHAANQPIYLETSTVENLAFYKRAGFEIYHEWESEEFGFPIWFLRYHPIAIGL